MKNYYAAIEFNFNNAKIIVVEFYKQKIHLIAAEKVKINGFFDGRIVDNVMFSKALINIKDLILDKYKINLTEVILVLPNNNHKVYDATARINVMSENQIISNKEINLVRTKCRQAPISSNECVIDDCPTLYILDNSCCLRTLPINYQSPFLEIRELLHTLPLDIVELLGNEFEKNKITILDAYINHLCSTEAVAQRFELEDGAISINIGDDITTIGVYMKNQLVASSRLVFGSDNLINHLKEHLHLSFEKASDLYNSYFIADLNLTTDIIFDDKLQLSERRISGIVLNHLTDAILTINESIASLKEQTNIEKVTYIVSGQLNDIEGFLDLFAETTQLPIRGGNISVVGLHGNDFINCYGAIKRFIELNKETINNRHEEDQLAAFEYTQQTAKNVNENLNKKKVIDLYDE